MTDPVNLQECCFGLEGPALLAHYRSLEHLSEEYGLSLVDLTTVLAEGGGIMRGYRFFRDHESAANKRRKVGNGNVIAVLLGEKGTPLDFPRNGVGVVMEAVTAVYDLPNSDVCSSSVSQGYLRQQCTKISEDEARRIHPALFAYLDRGEEELTPTKRPRQRVVRVRSGVLIVVLRYTWPR